LYTSFSFSIETLLLVKDGAGYKVFTIFVFFFSDYGLASVLKFLQMEIVGTPLMHYNNRLSRYSD